MSFETVGERITQTAGADLSASENLICKQGTGDNTVILATNDAAPLRGVVAEGGAGTGSAVTVQVSGVAKVIAGANVAAGALLTADAAGKAVAVSATVGNRFVIGEALETSGAANVLIAVLLRPGQGNTAVS